MYTPHNVSFVYFNQKFIFHTIDFDHIFCFQLLFDHLTLLLDLFLSQKTEKTNKQMKFKTNKETITTKSTIIFKKNKQAKSTQNTRTLFFFNVFTTTGLRGMRSILRVWLIQQCHPIWEHKFSFSHLVSISNSFLVWSETLWSHPLLSD